MSIVINHNVGMKVLHIDLHHLGKRKSKHYLQFEHFFRFRGQLVFSHRARQVQIFFCPLINESII